MRKGKFVSSLAVLLAVATSMMSSQAMAEVDCTAEMERGDFNMDGSVNIGDVGATLNHLFNGGPGIPCAGLSWVGDSNGDAQTNMADAVFTLNYLFSGGVAPAEPPICGVDNACCDDTKACPPADIYLDELRLYKAELDLLFQGIVVELLAEKEWLADAEQGLQDQVDFVAARKAELVAWKNLDKGAVMVALHTGAIAGFEVVATAKLVKIGATVIKNCGKLKDVKIWKWIKTQNKEENFEYVPVATSVAFRIAEEDDDEDGTMVQLVLENLPLVGAWHMIDKISEPAEFVAAYEATLPSEERAVVQWRDWVDELQAAVDDMNFILEELLVELDDIQAEIEAMEAEQECDAG